MHKNKALPERPKPPPFDEIIHDIEKCPDDDVVFSSYFPSGGKFCKIWISWITVRLSTTRVRAQYLDVLSSEIIEKSLYIIYINGTGSFCPESRSPP
jgi:hypothetical protein